MIAEADRFGFSAAQRVCVCVIKFIIQPHSTRVGYGGCWFFPPFSLPQSCPHQTGARTQVRSPIVRSGHPSPLYPILPDDYLLVRMAAR